MKKIFLATLMMPLFCFAQNSETTESPDSTAMTASLYGADVDALLSQDQSIAHFQNRYVLKDAYVKLVDNQGNGFEALYGVRNLRAVLSGVVYRGGANNVYNKFGKRANSNPLQNGGLKNLCEEGFGTAVYLYSTNYAGAPKQTSCQTASESANSIQYLQESVLLSEASAKRVLTLIHGRLTSATDHRPIYMHCWNGWHASGYISALTLRQFCGYSGDQAVAYWNRNTDGNNVGSGYDKIRSKIRAYNFDPNLSIDSALKAKVCPAR
ncbi:MAG: hypothetical protein EOP06_19500 [Proteobacteria bacterium]|nr:MAG: hypothetical protein EOP06_19500 [Pseudomonadota bacterium]